MRKGRHTLSTEYALETRNICKNFGKLRANDHISLKVRKNTIHAIVGENGAGKSTLMNILTNIVKQDMGEIILNGEEVVFKNPMDAAHHGIGMIYQEFMLCPHFTVFENIIVGFEEKKGLVIDYKKSREKVEKICKDYRFDLPLDELIDEYYLDFGIRTVKVEGTKFLINGKPFYFTGFGKHEDSEISGRGYNPPIIKRDFELIKWIGANSFRTSHYPYSEEIMQAADREGIVIIDEVAAVGMFDVGSVLNPGASKTDYFSLDEVHNKTKEVHKKAVEELIKRDKNHPSVVMWSLFNEPDTSKDEAVPYFEDIFNFAKSQDKQNLPKTFAAIQASSPGKCKCMHLCDVITLNRYYGWYFLGGYEIDMSEEKFREEMNLYSSMNKPVMFTEYGADTYAGVHKLPSVMWSEEYQCEYYEMNFKVFDSYDFIVGEQLWNFADFQTTEGIFRVDGNKKGIFTRNRQPKAVAHYIRNRWTKLPLDYKSQK